jgi:hypothetical protein
VKQSFAGQARGFARTLVYPIYSLIGHGLGVMETAISRRQSQPKWSPIFIVGLSRSGTTLLYQVLFNGFEVCYISNFTRLFPSAPVLLALLALPFRGCDPRPCFHSRFGITRGWNQPNSAFGLWKKWFTNGQGEASVAIRVEVARRFHLSCLDLMPSMWTLNLRGRAPSQTAIDARKESSTHQVCLQTTMAN